MIIAASQNMLYYFSNEHYYIKLLLGFYLKLRYQHVGMTLFYENIRFSQIFFIDFNIPL